MSELGPLAAVPVDAAAMGQAHQRYCQLTGQSVRLGFARSTGRAASPRLADA